MPQINREQLLSTLPETFVTLAKADSTVLEFLLQLANSERVMDNNGIELVTGQSNPKLAREIAEILKKHIDEPVTRFSDNEARVKYDCELRNKSIFIIQSTSPPNVDGAIMELLLMIDAAKRASAKEITAVMPYFGMGRQDRKEQSGVAISAALIANLLVAAGADRIVTLDIHSEQQQGFVNKPWDNLYASYAFMPILKERFDSKNLVVVSPDAGGGKRTLAYAKRLGAKVAFVYKNRNIHTGESQALFLNGDVRGQDVLITDDMLASGGTMLNAVEMLKQAGANTVTFLATHGLFLGESLEKITASPIDRIIVTDTIAHRQAVLDHPKIEIVSMAPLLAVAINNIHTGERMGDLFL